MLVKWNELIMEAEWKKQIIYKDRKLLTVDIRIRVYINNIYIYIYTLHIPALRRSSWGTIFDRIFFILHRGTSFENYKPQDKLVKRVVNWVKAK